MKVLFVINSLEIGGAETFLLRLLKQFDENKKVKAFLYILSPEKNDTEFAKYFLRETKVILIPNLVEDLKLKKWILHRLNGVCKRLFKHTFYEKQLEKKKKKHFKRYLQEIYQIDLINSHLFSSDLFVTNYLKSIVELPIVVTMQGCYNDINDIEGLNLAREIINNAAGITYVSKKNLSIFDKLNIRLLSNSALIYNGLPSNQFSVKKSKEVFIVGQVCRSIPSKGMEVAISAMILLKKEFPSSKIELHLYGPVNDYYNGLKNKYKELDYIVFQNSILNPINAVKTFNVGILPSYFPGESCPSTIIEYLSCGIPVITTNIGEIPEMLKCEKGKSGIMISKKDENNLPSVNEFYKAIKYYYENELRCLEDGMNALNAFKKFEITNASNQYMEIYKRIISEIK
ncbi:MAG: glycosyltransferase family 4 protein [Flavobacteriia bacterium]|nr:glycosyltransferase family 4 protein [Flavobacteriia bacterium]